MQQQMKSDKPGSGTCNKPGGKGSKPSMSGLKKMQKQLSDKISQMQGEMKNGEKPGDKPGEKPGQKTGGQNAGISKEFAEMAAQQAAIRDAMKQLNDDNTKNGQKPIPGLSEMQQLMDKTERDLANKNIDDATLKRQNEIMTRMLEAENAQREQDEDTKRKSNTANDLVPPVPPSLAEYLKKKQTEMELYKTLPPQLKPFYKSLVEDYFNKISQ